MFNRIRSFLRGLSQRRAVAQARIRARSHRLAALEAEGGAVPRGCCPLCRRRLIGVREREQGYCVVCWRLPEDQDALPPTTARAPRIGDTPRAILAGTRGIH